jgi:hypothetical protein
MSGCVTTEVATKRIQAFSDATTLVANNTKEAFDIAERKYFDVQVQRTVINYDRDGFQPNRFQPLFSAHSREVRDDVLNSFALYSQKLSAIMGNEQLEEFDQATKTFGEKLGGLSDSISATKTFSGSRTLEDGELKLVTTAVNAFGNWFIRVKREKGVRQAVISMDTNVAVICTALTNDLHTIRQTVANEYNFIMQSQDQFIQHNKDRLDPLVKRSEIHDLARLIKEARDQDATFVAINQSISKWRTVHGKLLEAFTKNTVEIDALLKQLIAEGQRVKKFYDSLDESSK